MCTVVLSFEPGERVPLLLLGVRDELTDRRWLPPARHWPGSPLIGGIDQQAGGTWLAVRPPASSRQQESDAPRVSCLLNGRGILADPACRRTRGELPLRAAADGPGALKELADDAGALAAYDPFHLVCADAGSVWLLSWDGERPAVRELAPGTHVLTNAGHAYPAGRVTDAKAAYFGPKFEAARPSGEPGLPPERAWGEWLTLAAGDGLDLGDPRAIIVRRELPGGRLWGTTSVTLAGLAADGLRYDFQPHPGADTGWYPVQVPL
ncbi:MAG TPA: NRDE family protein [Trebonia sp.]|nr:NRDE family protein [Trebonia sp.]